MIVPWPDIGCADDGDPARLAVPVFPGGMPILLLGAAVAQSRRRHIRLILFSAFPNPYSSFSLQAAGVAGYQVKKSLEAFPNRHPVRTLVGPGGNRSFRHPPIPMPTSFYAVAAEETGVFLCLSIIALYTVIVIRTMIISCKDNNVVYYLSASGLAASFRIAIHYQYGFNPAPDADKGNDAAALFPTEVLRCIAYAPSAWACCLPLLVKRSCVRIKMTSKAQKQNKTAESFSPPSGTGGHVYPAEALAEELTRRKYRLMLVTDRRRTQQLPRPFGRILPTTRSGPAPNGQIQMV